MKQNRRLLRITINGQNQFTPQKKLFSKTACGFIFTRLRHKHAEINENETPNFQPQNELK